MESSFLYHAFGVTRDYQYHATEYKDNAIYLKLQSISLKKVKCPHCGGTHVIKVTNAILEGTNNKVKVLKRKAYGYRDDEYFKLLLLGMKDETGKTE